MNNQNIHNQQPMSQDDKTKKGMLNNNQNVMNAPVQNNVNVGNNMSMQNNMNGSINAPVQNNIPKPYISQNNKPYISTNSNQNNNINRSVQNISNNVQKPVNMPINNNINSNVNLGSNNAGKVQTNNNVPMNNLNNQLNKSIPVNNQNVNNSNIQPNSVMNSSLVNKNDNASNNQTIKSSNSNDSISTLTSLETSNTIIPVMNKDVVSNQNNIVSGNNINNQISNANNVNNSNTNSPINPNNNINHSISMDNAPIANLTESRPSSMSTPFNVGQVNTISSTIPNPVNIPNQPVQNIFNPGANSISDNKSGSIFDASEFNSKPVSLDNRLENNNSEQELNIENEIQSNLNMDEEVEVLSYEYNKAKTLPRIFAYLVDSLVIILVSIIFYVASSTLFIFIDSPVLRIIQFILYIIISCFGFIFYRGINEKSGNTVGRKVTHTMVIKEGEGTIGMGILFLRTLVSLIINGSIIGTIVNIVLTITDKNRRTIEDMLFKTIVIRTDL